MPTRLRAVIFGWAGTIVDHGSRAPVAAFREVFRRRGVEVSAETAKAPMGLSKRDHLAAMLASEECASAWRHAIGHAPRAEDLDALCAEFLPIQCEILPRFAAVIPGVVELSGELRRRGLALGSTTGYSRAMLEILEPLAAAQGLTLDCVVCADEVRAGRPKPWMIVAAAEALDVYPPRAIVNVDGTSAGVAAGRNAGVWSVGVARTGSELGLSLNEATALNAVELEHRVAAAGQKLMAAGADFVIDSAADLPVALDLIEERIANGW